MIQAKVDSVIAHFLRAGTNDYIGEPLSQIEHSLQCAYFAEQAHHSEEVVLASLLHDIGHFFPTNEQYKMANLGTIHHEWIGAKLAYDFHFSPKVALLIGHHVDAKRYLAAKKPQYYQRLSSASQQTLAYQGGPMTVEEMLSFEQHPYFKEILQVRVNDEKAKEVDLIVPDLSYYQERIYRHLEQHRRDNGEYLPLPELVDAQWVMQFKKFLQSRNYDVELAP